MTAFEPLSWHEHEALRRSCEDSGVCVVVEDPVVVSTVARLVKSDIEMTVNKRAT